MKILSICVLALLSSSVALAQDDSYRVLATSKTSTMEKEMNQAGTDGYKFVAVMGGETAIGGKEVVVLMQHLRRRRSRRHRRTRQQDRVGLYLQADRDVEDLDP